MDPGVLLVARCRLPRVPVLCLSLSFSHSLRKKVAVLDHLDGLTALSHLCHVEDLGGGAVRQPLKALVGLARHRHAQRALVRR